MLKLIDKGTSLIINLPLMYVVCKQSGLAFKTEMTKTLNNGSTQIRWVRISWIISFYFGYNFADVSLF